MMKDDIIDCLLAGMGSEDIALELGVRPEAVREKINHLRRTGELKKIIDTQRENHARNLNGAAR